MCHVKSWWTQLVLAVLAINELVEVAEGVREKNMYDIYMRHVSFFYEYKVGTYFKSIFFLNRI